MSEWVEVARPQTSMTSDLSAEAVLIGGGVPEPNGLVMPEGACAVVGPFGTGSA